MSRGGSVARLPASLQPRREGGQHGVVQHHGHRWPPDLAASHHLAMLLKALIYENLPMFDVSQHNPQTCPRATPSTRAPPRPSPGSPVTRWAVVGPLLSRDRCARPWLAPLPRTRAWRTSARAPPSACVCGSGWWARWAVIGGQWTQCSSLIGQGWGPWQFFTGTVVRAFRLNNVFPSNTFLGVGALGAVCR